MRGSLSGCGWVKRGELLPSTLKVKQFSPASSMHEAGVLLTRYARNRQTKSPAAGMLERAESR